MIISYGRGWLSGSTWKLHFNTLLSENLGILNPSSGFYFKIMFGAVNIFSHSPPNFTPLGILCFGTTLIITCIK